MFLIALCVSFSFLELLIVSNLSLATSSKSSMSRYSFYGRVINCVPTKRIQYLSSSSDEDENATKANKEPKRDSKTICKPEESSSAVTKKSGSAVTEDSSSLLRKESAAKESLSAVTESKVNIAEKRKRLLRKPIF